MNRSHGTMNDEERSEQRELLKKLRERIKQLRMVEYIDDDEEPDVFIGGES